MGDTKIAGAFVEISTRQQKLDRELGQAKGKVTRFLGETKAAAGGVGKSIAGAFSSIGGGLLGGLGLGAGFAAFTGIKAGLEGVLDAAIADEKSQEKLRATLRSTGNEVENNAQRINDFADGLRDVANVDDDVTRSLVSLGLNLGIGADKIDDVVEASLGLAEATGGDATDAMEKLIKANQGNWTALQKQLPLLKEMKSQEERLAYVQKIAQQGMEQRRESLKTLGGSTQQLKLATGELAESVGGLLAPAFTSAAQAATKYINAIRQMAGASPAQQVLNLRNQLNASQSNVLATLTKMTAKKPPPAYTNWWNGPRAAGITVAARALNGKRGRNETPEQELQRRLDMRDQVYNGRSGIDNNNGNFAEHNEERINALRNEIRGKDQGVSGAAHKDLQHLNDKLNDAVRRERGGMSERDADRIYAKRADKIRLDDEERQLLRDIAKNTANQGSAVFR
jgi:hypothetical protein